MSAIVSHAKQPKKAATAAWIGSSLEYYDFFVYGTIAALVFPQVFFDPSDPTTASLASLASFGAGFIARPVGSLLMGHIGDRIGRRALLIGTLLLMGVSTFLIGCLPTYSSVGLWAPALLTFLRILQGLSASGEQAGASSLSFEHAPDDRRGYYSSWTLSGTVGGQVLSSAVVLPLSALLSHEEFLAWGWRVPFWLSAVVILVGYLIRRTLNETPAFEAEEEAGTVPTVPLKVLFQDHWQGLLRVFFAAFIGSTVTLFTIFGLAFATSDAYGIRISTGTMLSLSLVSHLIAIFTVPMFGALSDRIGRKRVFLAGIIGCAISLPLFFWSITTGSVALIFVTGILFNGLAFQMTNAVWPATYAEIFPTNVRLSGIAVGTQFAFPLVGFAPTIAFVLAGGTSAGWLSVSILGVAICLISGIAVAVGRETYKTPTAELGTEPARIRATLPQP